MIDDIMIVKFIWGKGCLVYLSNSAYRDIADTVKEFKILKP